MPDADHPQPLDEPLQRLGTSSRRTGVVGAIALVAALVVLAWQPWSTSPRPAPSVLTRPSAVARAVPGSSEPTATTAPSLAGGTPVPQPAGVGTYVSLIDNEWTVVAMLDVGPVASTEEPATQHGTSGPSGSGPYLVLQQGAHPMTRRVSDASGTKELCGSQVRPLDRIAVLLPAGRVAYLGITFPGMDPGATVSVAAIGRSAASLRRVKSPSLALVGLTVGSRYRIPSTGPGGTVLFRPTSATTLRSGAYRFEIRTPGIDGARFVYACIGG